MRFGYIFSFRLLLRYGLTREEVSENRGLPSKLVLYLGSICAWLAWFIFIIIIIQKKI